MKCPTPREVRAMSPADKKKFAEANIHASGPIGKMARMVYTAQGTHGNGKSTMAGAGDKRTKAQTLYQVG